MKCQRICLLLGTLLAAPAAMLLLQSASAQTLTIESWENTLDGWTVEQGAYSPSFSTTTGVTDGSYSLALTGTASPTYGQMLLSAWTPSWTSIFASATSLSLDVYTPPGSFGYYLQFDFDLNNADTGYVSLDGYSYIATTIGSETTLTVPIPASVSSTLASSSNPTQLAIQIGGGDTAGNETMYLDNLRVVEVPEPSTIALVGFGLLALVRLMPRRVR